MALCGKNNIPRATRKRPGDFATVMHTSYQRSKLLAIMDNVASISQLKINRSDRLHCGWWGERTTSSHDLSATLNFLLYRSLQFVIPRHVLLLEHALSCTRSIIRAKRRALSFSITLWGRYAITRYKGKKGTLSVRTCAQRLKKLVGYFSFEKTDRPGTG